MRMEVVEIGSKDKVINYRGRYLMKTMNDGEMIFGNGGRGTRQTILIITRTETRRLTFLGDAKFSKEPRML